MIYQHDRIRKSVRITVVVTTLCSQFRTELSVLCVGGIHGIAAEIVILGRGPTGVVALGFGIRNDSQAILQQVYLIVLLFPSLFFLSYFTS